ncbi:MAG: hypothetical protein ACI4AM_03850 [Muribaculaceae bacterium]
MKDLIPHIEYLLQSHDCVIVPGLGAVLAHRVSARYDDEAGCWMPPYRAMSFNSELTRTDGLLAASVARRRGVSIAAATQMVTAAVEQMRRTLSDDGSLDMGGAGTLTMEDGRITYQPATTGWASPQYLWMPRLDIARISGADHIALDDDDNVLHLRRARLWRGVLRIAASFVIILLVGWAVKVNLSDASKQQFASLWPISAEQEKPAEEPAVEGDADAPMTLLLPQQPEEVEPEVAPQLDGKYCVIVGSFANEAEAREFINAKPTETLGILTAGGRCRVYAATAATEAEAYAIATSASFVDRYPNSWVCRR